jgi:uncharacterized repeat protein (TIGR02543 family)
LTAFFNTIFKIIHIKYSGDLKMSLKKHFMLIMAMALCGSLTVTPVHAASHNVATEADLTAALADTDPVIDITVTADITITSSKVVLSGKTVNLTSDGTGNSRKVMLRGANMTGSGYGSTISQLFRVNRNGGVLNLSNIILDGNNSDGTGVNANSELIFNSGDVTLGSGVVLRNNRNMSGDGAVGSSNSVGGGITVFPGPTDTAATGNATLTILDGAEITNNVAALGCGVVLFSGSNAPATHRAIATMEGGKIHGNRAFLAAGVYVIQNAEFHLEGGEIYDNHADMAKTDFTLINGDYIGAYINVGGGVFTTAANSDFYMSGGKIYNNTATGSAAGVAGRGGGIEAASSGRNFVITGGEIYGNTASNYGGGISSYRVVTISGDTQIYGNTAPLGGAIFQTFNGTIPSVVTLNDNVQIKNNTATTDGGGIYAYNGASVKANDQTQITNNTANRNGGGIWVAYADLARVDIGADVSFANNRAQAAYLIADADKPTHATHVLTTIFTQPFDQPAINWGYNNYDIAYTAGALNFVVSFDSVGGSAVAPELVAPGNAAKRPADPTRSGHTFLDWYVDSNYSATYDFPTLVDSDRTLYARWHPTATNTTTPVPTTGGGVLAALGVLLAGLGAGTLRRRRG